MNEPDGIHVFMPLPSATACISGSAGIGIGTEVLTAAVAVLFGADGRNGLNPVVSMRTGTLCTDAMFLVRLDKKAEPLR